MGIINSGELVYNQDTEQIMAQVNKEHLKTLFYMFAGKPDSITKPFPKDVTISIDDLKSLNRKVQEKLNNYATNAVITTVNISYSSGEGKEFGSWLEFDTHDWTTSLLAVRLY